jgi:hypothetical protein
MYFNKKYNRRGGVFESAFKASYILNDSYLLHITRYIHLNPDKYKQWRHSSYRDYSDPGGRVRSWIDITPIMELFGSRQEYINFADDYKDMRDELEDLKRDLADNADSIL